MGTGHSRYCTIHRHRKYRKIIDASKIAAKKAEEEARNPNQIINHSYTNTVIVVQKCKLEGCFNEFEIKIFPNVFCYPKYCENHRNSWKREFFLNKNKDK